MTPYHHISHQMFLMKSKVTFYKTQEINSKIQVTYNMEKHDALEAEHLNTKNMTHFFLNLTILAKHCAYGVLCNRFNSGNLLIETSDH